MTHSIEEGSSRFKGVMTALITPFKNGVVDHDALIDLADWQIQFGISALVACGTTGEAPTLAWDERLKIIRACVKASHGRVPVIAGTGTNSTELTIAHTSAAQSCGADAALVVTPYYNKPSQEGIVCHYEAIAQRVDLPLIVYNVPSRTGVDLSLATIARLAEIPSIIGLKDATGEVRRVEEMRRAFEDRFILLSGHDATSHAFNLSGGDGTISVVANVLPHVFVALHNACMKRDWSTARYIQDRLQALYKAFDLDPNPCPIKYALKYRRGMSDAVRLPLVPVSPDTAEKIRIALDRLCRPVSQDQSDPADAVFISCESTSPTEPTPLAWRL
ncbi:MAG: 4-hydroxy-tetrahydrodipicolinate synthase [Phyllobacterium sp.]|uniref:4-hydroxy-tetrahydrodipicolinate synthase n=1 Tax=Phyllobacterium sp. TaxID=1871046 RepID=UPI0030F08CBC